MINNILPQKNEAFGIMANKTQKREIFMPELKTLQESKIN